MKKHSCLLRLFMMLVLFRAGGSVVLYAQMEGCTIMNVPYICRFDTMPGWPYCWDFNGSAQIIDEEQALSFSGSITSPKIAENIPMDSLAIQFKVHTPNWGDYGSELYIGFQDSIGGEFIPYDTLEYDSHVFNRVYTISLSNYHGTARYICLRSQYSTFLKDFILDYEHFCHNPETFVLDSISNNWAAVSWQPVQGESLWRYACCPSLTVPTQWYSTTTPNVLIQNLDPMTTYDIYIHALCQPHDNTNAPNTPAGSFTTECPDTISIPFVEDFQSYFYEHCWYVRENIGSINSYPPPISDSREMQDLILYLDFWPQTPNKWVEIGVQSDMNDASTYQVIQHIDVERAWRIYHYEIILNGYGGDAKYILFKYSSDIDPLRFELQETPPCIYPYPVTSNHITSSSARIQFTNRGYETSWELAYDTTGFDPDNGGNHMVINAPVATLNNLSPLTTYDVYVRAICGHQQGSWSIVHTFTTQCMPITEIPYSENFDSYGTGQDENFPSCWFRYTPLQDAQPSHIENYLTFSDSSYAYSTPGALKLEGTSNSVSYQMATLPQIDTSSIDIRGLKLSFNLTRRLSGQDSVVVGVMSDPYSASTFVPVKTVADPHNTVAFNNFHGYGNYIGFLSKGVTYIDDVILDYAVCGEPIHLAVDNVLGTSAHLTWEPVEYGLEQRYVVLYRDHQSATWDSVFVTGHDLWLNDLMQETDYDVRVYCQCAAGAGEEVSVSFQTLCESVTQFVTGITTTTQSQLPLGGMSSYAYTQQIFSAQELALGDVTDDISAIEFSYKISHRTCQQPHAYIEVYMANTTQDVFANPNSWIPFDSLTLVFADTVWPIPSNDYNWLRLNLSNSFTYNGTDNIVIAMLLNEENTEFFCLSAGEVTNANRSIFVTSNNPIVPSEPIAGTYDSRLRSIFRLSKCSSSSSCATPNLSLVSVNGSDADLVIAPGGNETSWEYQYRKTTDSVWSSAINTPSTALTINSLALNSDYVVRVRSICPWGGNSEWDMVYFSTECETIDSLPYVEYFDDYYVDEFTTLIPKCWTGIPFIDHAALGIYLGNSEHSYSVPNALSLPHNTAIALPPVANDIQVFSLMLNFKAKSAIGVSSIRIGALEFPSDTLSFISDTSLVIGNTWEEYEVPLTALNGMLSSEKYVALINTNYDVLIDNLILDYTPGCMHPNNVACDTTLGDTIVLSWTERGDATNWNVEYGPHGYEPGTGTVVHVTSNPCSLSGLPLNQLLDFYAQSNCGNGETSDWSHQCATQATVPCAAEDQCPLMFILQDPDPSTPGWGDCSVDIYADEILRYEVQLTTSGPDTVYIPICDGSTVTCFGRNAYGGQLSGIQYSVFAPNGELIGENIGMGASTAPMLTYEHFCDLTSCISPIHLYDDSVSDDIAVLDWQPLGSESSWIVEFKPTEDTTWMSTIANSRPFTLHNLSSFTNYDVRVRALCDDGNESSFHNVIHFKTDCGGSMTTIGAGNFTYNGNLPDFDKKYSYSQQIFTAQELASISYISKIELLNTQYYDNYEWDIYMGHTSQSYFDETLPDSIIVNTYVNPESLSLVFSGTITDLNQEPEHWLTIYLDSLFLYNGTDNLVVAIYNHLGQNRFNSHKWKTFQNSNSWTEPFRSIHSEGAQPFELSYHGLSQLYTPVFSAERNVIRFPNCCTAPNNAVVQTDANTLSASVSWHPGGQEEHWQLEYKTVSATVWDTVLCTAPMHTIANVLPYENYMGRIMSICDTSNGSSSDYITFSFMVIPSAPESYTILSSAGTGGTILPIGTINIMGGYDITFDIVADTAAGYVIQDVLVDNASMGALSSYTFSLVHADHTIHAEFQNVGIDDLPEENLVLYPNPTNGKLTVSGSKFQVSSIEIYDVYGKLLQTVAVNDVAADLDVTHLPAGLYFARIRTDNDVVTKRFVKR
ncbi:MAG: fibronectin type III domain-containing protein [Bacteroidales bacterium]|nr:fibronectin type III domain-containing protein [Bacteroidales bacterium]